MDARSEEKLSCAQKRRKIYANNWAKCCINSDIDNFIRLHKRNYKFENGKPLTFLDLEFIRLLFIDTNKLLITLIQSENISNINEIVSLYSKIDFMNN